MTERVDQRSLRPSQSPYDKIIVILNEVKNLVLLHLINITSLIRSFGALRMTKIRQIAAQTESAQSKNARVMGSLSKTEQMCYTIHE